RAPRRGTVACRSCATSVLAGRRRRRSRRRPSSRTSGSGRPATPPGPGRSARRGLPPAPAPRRADRAARRSYGTRRSRARGGRRRPRQLPALLMRDALALLDREHVDEPRERMAQQPEVLLPVLRRMRQRVHLVQRERERRAITLLRGEPQLVENFLAADPRR